MKKSVTALLNNIQSQHSPLSLPLIFPSFEQQTMARSRRRRIIIITTSIYSLYYT